MTRSQPFLLSGADVVPELRVVRAFSDVVASISGVLESELKPDILSTFRRRIVVKALERGHWERPLLMGIDQLNEFGSKLYEGSAISATLGFRNMRGPNTEVTLEKMAREDFGSVLSNGHDTMLEFNYEGGLVSHVALPATVDVPSFCPFRQGAIADWTGGHDNRIAMSLNRLGEILIFQRKKLLFAKRSGRWHFLTHEPVIKQMNVPRDPKLRRAIYETCLDASFTRTGACIGVVQVNGGRGWRETISDDDLISTSITTKGRTLRRVIAGRKFQDLDRRTRQEISAIDGATVISHQGELIAAGAILQIQGGSTGGGRLAAARQLSTFGLGIKVSQDGGITGYRPGSQVADFRIM